MRTSVQKQNQPQKRESSSLARFNTPTFGTPTFGAPTCGPNIPSHPILRLQRAIGNQAVQRMLQTNAGGGEAENRTGMPHSLKTGLEALSGMDLSGIRVHRNSSKPAQLNALAYTRGQEIHVGPGQEAHLPHEGWHAVQQMQGRVQPTMQMNGEAINDDTRLEREADVMGAKALRDMSFGQNNADQKVSPSSSAAPSAVYSLRPTIQREMKFELQTKNKIYRNDGKTAKLLDRKYGPQDFLVKGETGVRLESETHGVLEFETEWFRKWSALKKQLEEAVEMTKKMSEAPDVGEGRKAFPFDVSHLREGSPSELRKGVWDWKKGYEGANEKILRTGETLEVKIDDPTWDAGIQSSEGILLEQYESFLRQHEWPAYKEPVIESAQAILDAANAGGIPATELVNLRSFLQIIVNYIMRGQGGPASESAGAFADVKDLPSKQAFTLMSRTNFASIYKELLSDKEKALYKKIVQSEEILKRLGLNQKSPFFIKGYGKRSGPGPTVHQWLVGIHQGKDVLSARTGKGLSAAMGKYDVETEKGKKDTGLVKFETRNTVLGAWRQAKDWVDYAEGLFKYAAENRKRPDVKDDPSTTQDETEKTTLIYDSAPKASFEVVPRLTLKLGDEKKLGFDAEFRKTLPTLLAGKLQPFVYTEIGTSGLAAGVGVSADPIKDMSLFLTGKVGVHTDWFKSIEVEGGLEAGWAFGKSRSLRLGIGWETWQQLDEEKKRTHLVNVFLGKRF